MAYLVIVPGWRDSGPSLWQTLWAEQIQGSLRVHQDDWITPVRKAWIASISQTILEQPSPVVVAAHSLGCNGLNVI
jgi:predicted alpha/beta hydrolase family esterase